jgi:hypothetical protein
MERRARCAHTLVSTSTEKGAREEEREMDRGRERGEREMEGERARASMRERKLNR